MTKKLQFHPEAPLIQYHQNSSNSCCLSSLAWAFDCIVDNRAVTDLVNSIESSLTLQKKEFKNRIHFANAIIKNRRGIKGEQNLQYILTIWNKNDAIDILNYIGQYVTLVQLMDSLGNLNNAISIVGYWISDSKYKKSLCLKQEPLDIICSPSIGK